MNDFFYALRRLARRRTVTIAVIAMLACGIGGTTAVYSIFHTVLLNRLPITEPKRVVKLDAVGPKFGATTCSVMASCSQLFSYPMYRDLRAKQTAFTDIAAHRDFTASLAHGARARSGDGMLVSDGYFSVLGLNPALGRLIGPQDEPKIGEAAVAVLSYDYWRSDFGADSSVIGRALTVNGRDLTIIGVAPRGFTGTAFGVRPQVFVPLTLRWLMEPQRHQDAENRRSYWLYLFARLKPGISAQQASEGLNRLYSAIINDVEVPLQTGLSEEALRQFRRSRIALLPGGRAESQISEAAEQPLRLLMVVSTLVLLIVCANIAMLLLAQGKSRAGEIAVRHSLGASRSRLVRQLCMESAVLALAGGLLSLPVAMGATSGIAALLPAGSHWVSTELSGTVMEAAAAVSLATVLLFGLAPALSATRTQPALVIKGQAARSTGGAAVARFRGFLGGAQVAFSMILLVMAGLFMRSLLNLVHVNLGMKLDSVVTFTVSPRLSGYAPGEAKSIYDRIEQALAAEPGVERVASSRILPMSGRQWRMPVVIDGFERTPVQQRLAAGNEVSPGFFDTLSIQILTGRGFADSDRTGSGRVAVVNNSFVRKFQLGRDAIGKRFGFGAGTAKRDIEIVGIVADATYSTVRNETPAQYYLPWRQDQNLDALSFFVRSTVDPQTLLRAIPGIVRHIDPQLPVINLATMRSTFRDNIYFHRLVAILAAIFASLATLIAAVGVYGVLANGVADRTRELGLRLALGATPGRLRAMVLQQIAAISIVGGLLGLGLGIALARLAAALLFGVSQYDPAVLAFAAATLGVVVAAAGYFPARRAAKTAPIEALRYE